MPRFALNDFITTVVLGIELDLSIKLPACLPADKLSALQGLISPWLPHTRWCNRCELESLIGHLQCGVAWQNLPTLHD